ncbi:DUF7336 domain-containing protein [Fusobacterium canifelinum]|uniref:DUF7336 domain-containing protein n=1 Tax=Fusobacterium canifelinum TaxID=285729 RepID=UPI0030D015FF
MKIYVLSHSYECDVEKTKDEGRFLGVYLTKKEAIKKVEMYKKIKGFSSHISNFYISCYTVDKTLEWLNNYSIDNWHAVAFMGKFYKQNIE